MPERVVDELLRLDFVGDVAVCIRPALQVPRPGKEAGAPCDEREEERAAERGKVRLCEVQWVGGCGL